MSSLPQQGIRHLLLLPTGIHTQVFTHIHKNETNLKNEQATLCSILWLLVFPRHPHSRKLKRNTAGPWVMFCCHAHSVFKLCDEQGIVLTGSSSFGGLESVTLWLWVTRPDRSHVQICASGKVNTLFARADSLGLVCHGAGQSLGKSPIFSKLQSFCCVNDSYVQEQGCSKTWWHCL